MTDLGAAFASGQFYDLLDFTTLSGVGEGDLSSILNLPNVSGLGLNWETSLFRSDGILYLASGAIPEPSRAILILGGLVCLAFRRRR